MTGPTPGLLVGLGGGGAAPAPPAQAEVVGQQEVAGPAATNLQDSLGSIIFLHFFEVINSTLGLPIGDFADSPKWIPSST